MNLKEVIRTIPDFPKKGIYFKDLTPVWNNNDAVNFIVTKFIDFSSDKKITKIVGIESRGFILGSILANKLNLGFVPIRKKGKLPSKTLSQEYLLEYGKDEIEIHCEDLNSGDRVLIHDDVLATGGTMEAAIKLVEKTGAIVCGVCVVIELEFLNGIKKFPNYKFLSLVKYSSEKSE